MVSNYEKRLRPVEGDDMIWVVQDFINFCLFAKWHRVSKFGWRGQKPALMLRQIKASTFWRSSVKPHQAGEPYDSAIAYTVSLHSNAVWQLGMPTVGNSSEIYWRCPEREDGPLRTVHCPAKVKSALPFSVLLVSRCYEQRCQQV